jgi:hypothetical protein
MSFKLSIVFLVAVGVVLCVIPSVMDAQVVNATLLGTVSDASGAVVANAKVAALEQGTGVVHVTETNGSGNYVFPDMPPGTYTITVELSGFKKNVRKDVALSVNTSQRVDVQVMPGDVTETVEVTAAAPMLQTDRSDTGRNLDSLVVQNLPLSTNRNFQSLLNLVPGVAYTTIQHSQFFNASSSLQTEVNGGARQVNNYMIEGIDDNERTGLLQVIIPPIEAIQTVDVSTSNHDVAFGRSAGAVTNVILKSGTNNWHGSAYEFLQNSAFDARSFFNPSVGHMAYNYWGGTAGGPIKKNKLFIFGDFLRSTDHEANANLVTIPSTLSRTGNLSENANKVYDPLTGDASTGIGRTAFPGNIIPASRIDPISLKILALIPQPNLPTNPAAPSNNYYALLPFYKNTNYTDEKVDYTMSDKDRLSGRFSFQRPVIYQAPIFGMAGGPGNSGFQGTGIQKTYSSGINWNHIFSATLLMEVRVGVAHYHNEATPSDYGSNDAQSLGIPNINVSQFTSGQVGVRLDSFTNGGGYGLTGYVNSLPWTRAEANIDLVNNWTKIHGNHTFRFGFDMRRLRDDLLQTQTYSPRGVYSFGANQTACAGNCPGVSGTGPDPNTSWANSMGSFLLDLPQVSNSGRDFSIIFPTFRAWEYFFFVGDKWQVSRKLTLDLGLRWELYPPATAAHPGQFSNYMPYSNQLVIAGVGGNPGNMGMVNGLHYFAPRIGMAYRMTPKTVIRAGFGMSYTPFEDNKYAWDNYPVKGNVGLNNGASSYVAAVLPSGQAASFQTGIPVPPPVAIPSNGILTLGSSFNATSMETVPLNWKNPYVEAWNLSFQRELPAHFVFDLAYVGNHGVRIGVARNINVASFTAPTSAIGNTDYLLYPRTGSTTLYWDGMSSMYNSLQTKLDRRFTNGLGITTAFTFGKGMGYQTGDDGGLQGFYLTGQGHRNYGRNDFDRTFTFVQSYVYQLPFGKNKPFLKSPGLDRIVGGWQLQGILSVSSGQPFNVTYSATYLNAPGNVNTPVQVTPSVSILKGINSASNGGSPWFDPTAFAAPPCQSATPTSACPSGQQLGTIGRNALTGPGFFNVNLTLSKNTKLTERVGMELRLESFNTTNTTAFGNPNGSCCTSNNANFGYVTGVLNPGGNGTEITGVGVNRYIELGLKFSF